MRTVAHLSLAVLVAGLALPASLTAQRQHVGELTGDLPPDNSNWPHPAAPDGNMFPRSTDPQPEIDLRDQIAQLGKAVFWDEQLSSDNTMSCGTCHLPSAGGKDNRMGAVHPNGNFGTFGVIPQSTLGTGNVDYGFLSPPSPDYDRLVTEVSAPTMIGAYMYNQLFWDRRAGPDFDDGTGTNTPVPNFDDWAALEDLAVGPPISEVEMSHEGIDWASGFIQSKFGDSFPLAMVDPGTVPPDITWVMGTGGNYHDVFDTVFSGHPDPTLDGGSGVTRERLAAAVAHYHRTLIPDQAPIDLGTMSDMQVEGFHILHDRGCFECHSATRSPQLDPVTLTLVDPFDNLFSDGEEHDVNIGSGPRKTPTLRNLGLSVKFFSTGHGGDGTNRVFVNNQNDLLDFFENEPPPLGTGPLSAFERSAVADFMFNALLDPRVANETAPFDRPQLYSEVNPFEANEYGVGTPPPGSAVAPEILANAPPQILPNGGQSWFKVGVGDAEPFAHAYLMVDPNPAGGPTMWVAGPMSYLYAGQVSADGLATIQQPVPLTTAMLGVPFYGQWLFRSSYGASFSNAARFVPFYW